MQGEKGDPPPKKQVSSLSFLGKGKIREKYNMGGPRNGKGERYWFGWTNGRRTTPQ